MRHKKAFDRWPRRKLVGPLDQKIIAGDLLTHERMLFKGIVVYKQSAHERMLSDAVRSPHPIETTNCEMMKT